MCFAVLQKEMAYSLIPQKPVVEFHNAQRSHSLTSQTDLISNTGHCLVTRTFSYLVKCKCRNESYHHWVGFVASRRSAFMRCKSQQLGVSTDRVADDRTLLSPARYENGVGRNSSHNVIGKKYQKSLKGSVREPSVYNDAKTNNEILQKFCNYGKLVEALKLVKMMARLNQIPHFSSCINLIRGLVNIDHVDDAVVVRQIMVMSGGIPDVITYNMLIGGMCKKGQLDCAVDLLEEMNLSGCSPDVITYNTILRSMFDHGKIDQGIQFWNEQLRNGCPPYIITYTILLELVCKHCGVARAIEVMDDLAAEGCTPDLVTYNSMINFSCKQGKKFGDAALVICHLLSRGMEPTAVTYNTLLHALCSHGHWDQVDAILSVMNDTSHPPTLVTYNILINSLCKRGLLARAIDFLDQMVLRDCSPDIITYNTLLRALFKEGMVYEAIQIFYCVCETACSLTLITYNIMIDGLAKNGFMEKAMELYTHMVQQQGITPDAITYRCLMWGFCRCDMVEEAVEVLKAMGNSKSKIRDNCYRFLICRFCQNKKMGSAIQVLKMMLASRRGPHAALCSTILEEVADTGLTDEAEEIRKHLVEWKVLKAESSGS